MASHLGLRCLTISHLWDARLKWVKSVLQVCENSQISNNFIKSYLFYTHLAYQMIQVTNKNKTTSLVLISDSGFFLVSYPDLVDYLLEMISLPLPPTLGRVVLLLLSCCFTSTVNI